MGYSLRKLLAAVEAMYEKALAHLAGLEGISFAATSAMALARWEISAAEALVACLWAWLENQVMAAMKALSLSPLAIRGGEPYLCPVDKLRDGPQVSRE